MTYQNIPFTRSVPRKAGPPTGNFDEQAATYAAEVVTDDPEGSAPTRIAAPAAPEPEPTQEASRRIRWPAQAFLSVRSLANAAFFSLAWGFLRLLRGQLQPELIAAVDFALSPVMLAAIAVVLTTAASLMEAQSLARLRNVQIDLNDQMPVDAEALRNLRQKWQAATRLRDMTIIALATYLLVASV